MYRLSRDLRVLRNCEIQESKLDLAMEYYALVPHIQFFYSQHKIPFVRGGIRLLSDGIVSLEMAWKLFQKFCFNHNIVLPFIPICTVNGKLLDKLLKGASSYTRRKF